AASRPPAASGSADSISTATGGARSTSAASSPSESPIRYGGAGSISTDSRHGARRLPLHERPHLVLPDGAVVLAECLREEVPAGVHGDEVEIARVGRLDGRLQGRGARIADRTGRQARVAVGVVARIDLEIVLADVPVERVPHGQ